uniref:Uncharacterized protein n=1 Tax=Arion vulgaris TaxID=1028688 RepID=A0A0B7AX90_9EUPU
MKSIEIYQYKSQSQSLSSAITCNIINKLGGGNKTIIKTVRYERERGERDSRDEYDTLYEITNNITKGTRLSYFTSGQVTTD